MNKTYIMRKLNTIKSNFILVLLIGLISLTVSGQVGIKIRDNSVPGTPSNPAPGALFEVESNMRGVLLSRMTTAERDAIPTSSLINGLTIFNTTTNCYNYYQESIHTWLSMCGTLPQANLAVAQCSAVTVQGVYKAGEPLNQTHFITVPVTVTQPGTYEITGTANGFYFEKSGTFPTTGTYTLTLQGVGTPVAAGTETVTISINNVVQSCTFTITVIPAATEFSMLCPSITVGGSYVQGVALNASNTLTLTVNVTAAGNYMISTNTVNGYSFSGSGNFTTLGNQTVVLQGSGTPAAPGANTVTLTGSATTAGSCTVNITVAVPPVSYTINCGGITVSGSYMTGTAMTAANKMTVPVTVASVGSYTISTDVVNGISFSGSGTFSTVGTQVVTLMATGVPVAAGSFLFTVSGVGNSGASCTKSIAFTNMYRTMRVLGLGIGLGQPATAQTGYSPKEILMSTVNFGPSGTVPVQGISLFNGGTNQGYSLKSTINTYNIDIVIVGTGYSPSAETTSVLNNFVKNKKGVLIYASNESNFTQEQNLVNTICGASTTINAQGGGSISATVTSVSDPILNGPFGNIQGLKLGQDGSAQRNYIISGLPATVAPLAIHPTLAGVFAFKHNTLGFFYCGDGVWASGSSTHQSLYNYPAKIDASGRPQPKAYAPPGTTVYNSLLYANTWAWAIKYVQENTDSGYLIP